MILSEVLKSSPVRATGFFAAVLAIAGAIVGAGAWVQSVNSSLSKLQTELDQALALTIQEERQDAIRDINERLSEALQIMDRRKIDIEKLRAEVRTNHGENLSLLAEMRSGADTSMDKQVANFRQRLEAELSEFKAWTAAEISKEKESLVSDIAEVSAIKSEVQKLSATSAESVYDFESRFSDALEKVDEFETIVRAYQSHLQSDLDKVLAVPTGSLIVVAGEQSCPRGFERHARTLHFVLSEDVSRLGSNDFLQDSTFDLGTFLSGQTRAIGFVAPNLPSPQTSYHGQVALVCKAE